jgi:hypothetical protein
MQLATSTQPAAKFHPLSKITRSEMLHSAFCMQCSPYIKTSCSSSRICPWATLYQLNKFSCPSHLNLTLSRNVNAANCTGISKRLVNSSESSSGWYSAVRKESLVFSYGMD